MTTALAPALPLERRLSLDVLLTLGGKVLTLILGLVTTVVIARSLGPAGRGTLAVALGLTQLLVQLGNFGLTTANPYFAARRSDSVGAIVTNSIWVATVLGALLMSIGLGLYFWLPDVVAGVNWPELTIALAATPAMLGAAFLQGVLLGEGRMVAYNGIEVAQGVVTLAALACGFALFDLKSTGALAILGLSVYAGFAAYTMLLRRHVQRFRLPDVALLRRMLAYGLRIYVAALVAFLVIRVDVLLVNGYLGSEQAGVYSVVAALAEGMYMLPLVIGLNLFTRVAGGASSELSVEVFRLVGVVYGMVCLASIPLAAPAVHLAFGAGFEGAVDLYYWILPGIYSLGMLTILSHHFAGRGFPIEAMLVWLVALAVNVGLNVALLDRHGTYIASLASSIAYGLLLLLHVRLFAREVGGYHKLVPRPQDLRRLVAELRPRGAY